MKRLIRFSCFLLGMVCVFGIGAAAAGCFLLPDSYTMTENDTLDLGYLYRLDSATQPVLAQTSSGEDCERFEADVSVLGIIPVKTVEVTQTRRQQVVVCGTVCGLRIYSDGVSVVDTDTVQTNLGLKQPAFDAGFMKGDTIIAVNGHEVLSAADVSDEIDAVGGGEVVFTVRRGETQIDISLHPVLDVNTGTYRTGLWLRDSAAGIGTMTFYDPETNVFACLGHAVSDADTGLTVPVRKGDVLSASINAIRKGSNGTAGEIAGSLGDTVLGTIAENADLGVYGVLSQTPNAYGLFPVAYSSEVQTGEAEVITSIDNNGPRAYSMVIERIDAGDNGNKSMIVRITDTALLAATGGIVQGMSGSPIIQNGMLVGAVTHVFLDDSAKGYAILAETMLQQTQQIETAQNAA